MMFSKTECMPTLMELPESIQNNSNLDTLHWTLWAIFYWCRTLEDENRKKMSTTKSIFNLESLNLDQKVLCYHRNKVSLLS